MFGHSQWQPYDTGYMRGEKITFGGWIARVFQIGDQWHWSVEHRAAGRVGNVGQGVEWAWDAAQRMAQDCVLTALAGLPVGREPRRRGRAHVKARRKALVVNQHWYREVADGLR